MEKFLTDENKSLIGRLGVFFTIIYAVQGLSQGGPSGLFYLPFSFMLKEKMGFGPEQLAYFQGLVMVPWAIKPLYGLLSDFLPILGWRRRSYFVIAAGIASFAALYLAKFCDWSYDQILFFMMATALGIAFCDVLCDAVMVENGKRFDMTDKFQAIQWRAISFSAVLSGLGGGIIAKYLTYQQTFLLLAALPSIIFMAAIFFVPEKRYQYKNSADKSGVRSIIKAKDLATILIANAVLLPLLLWLNLYYIEMKTLRFLLLIVPFLILISITYIFRETLNKKIIFCMAFLFWWDFSLYLCGTPILYYEIDTLGFSEIFLGTLSTIGSAGAVLGAWLFAKISRKKIVWGKRALTDLNFGKMLYYSLFIGVASILSTFLLMGTKSAVALAIIFGFIFMFAHLTILVLAAKFCPSQIEGTFFALLMSVINFGASISACVSSALYKFFYSSAPANFANNIPAKFMVWLGWPMNWIAQPSKSADFAQYYAIFWLLIISLFLFCLYFFAIPRFRESIKDEKEPETLDISRIFSKKLR